MSVGRGHLEAGDNGGSDARFKGFSCMSRHVCGRM